MSDLDITTICEKDLSEELAEEIRVLQERAFPQAEVFRAQRWSCSPLADDDVWILARHAGKLVGSMRVLHRRVSTPSCDVPAAGIGNVCSSPEARGLGIGKACMRAAHRYIADSAVDFGLLFCRDRVRNFYAKLDWQDVNNPVLIEDDSGVHPLIDRHTMIYPGRRPANDWPTGELRLNGPRW